MHNRRLIICAWLGIVILAAFLRLNDLEQRPIHADEATGARILSNRLEAGTYQFDPQHFHGPLLSITAAPIAHVVDESSWATLSKQTLRLGPALSGILLVLCPLLWHRHVGSNAAIIAAALIGTSPLLVYYNRMYIHESLLTLLAMLTLPAIYKLLREPTLRIALVAGLGIGLMFATKETFAISIIAWLCACCAYYLSYRIKWHNNDNEPLTLQQYLLPGLICASAAAMCAGFFYSNGFRSFIGIVDAVSTFFVYESTAGHEKAANYYFQLLIWPKHLLGQYWSEGLVGILAVIGCLTAWRQSSQRRVLIFLACTSIVHFAIYSMIGYKTPWLMLVPWAHACLLAGLSVSACINHKVSIRILYSGALIIGLAYQTEQSLHATGRYASDARNPYAYVPTSKDTETLKTWLDILAATPGIEAVTPIAVIGNEYWPLPWYLKQFETIGYWANPEPLITDLPIVFAMPSQNIATEALLNDSHTVLPRSLRAEVPVMLYLRNDIWKHWTGAGDE